jgi:hypothetical protein
VCRSRLSPCSKQCFPFLDDLTADTDLKKEAQSLVGVTLNSLLTPNCMSLCAVISHQLFVFKQKLALFSISHEIYTA